MTKAKGVTVPAKLPGTKRVRLNFVLDHETSKRFRRQAKARGITLSDAFRQGIELLEKQEAEQLEVIKAAVS